MLPDSYVDPEHKDYGGTLLCINSFYCPNSSLYAGVNNRSVRDIYV